MRVEAGYNLGELSWRVGKKDKAQAVWWNEVIAPFLLDEKKAPELGAKGRWWMSRTLLEVGNVYESQNRLEEAKRAWRLIVDKGLPGATLAKARLARYSPSDPKSPEPAIHVPGAPAAATSTS